MDTKYGFDSPFSDAIAPVQGPKGDWADQTNGVDVRDGMKGTPGIMPEVATVSAPKGSGAAGLGAGDSMMDAPTEAKIKGS